MKAFFYLYIIYTFIFCFSCKTTRPPFDPDRKYTPAQLKKDYTLFRNILEDSHPSLYWYTTRDSLNYYFDNGYRQLTDSMTLPQFRALLSYTVAKINCGHTSIQYSKVYNRYLDTARLKIFPLSLKFWGDTMVVSGNIDRKDTILKRGVVLKSIAGMNQARITDTFFNYLVTDGYSMTGKYQSLSSDFTFGSWYKSLFGLPETIPVRYLDNEGLEKEVALRPFDPRSDNRPFPGMTGNPGKRPNRKMRARFSGSFSRNLQIDTLGNTAYMTLNTFAHGFGLRSFFRSAFSTLDEKHIKSLVIDVRSNGGGDASNSTFLTQYLISKKFKLADSLYAIRRHSRYDRYIGKSFLYNMLMFFVTSKREDGKYHFGYFERHYYEPKKNHHFDGQVYILIGGNSFSATTLFAGALKGQSNITLVGEETGGAYYGNTAWMIPEVTLPNTRLRFRLPKFHMVVDKTRIKDGRGVMPDVPVPPTTAAIKNGIDFKAEKAHELILQRVAESP